MAPYISDLVHESHVMTRNSIHDIITSVTEVKSQFIYRLAKLSLIKMCHSLYADCGVCLKSET